MLRRVLIGLLLLALGFIVACRQDESPLAVSTAGVSPDATPLPAENTPGASGAPATIPPPTPIPPTPTPTEPLAATVNGQPIFLAEYEKELSRYEQAQAQLGLSPDEQSTNYRTVVLNALIETELIAQAAAEFGISLAPETVDARLAELEELSGGPESFEAWLQTNQLTREEFREALATEMLTEETVAVVTADVPTAVEQVHASYIQVDDQTLAQSLLDQIRNGADFALLAQQYSLDRVTGENGGDLGFFARGSLLVPVVEEAAFNLQPGEVSEVISGPLADGTGTTYYIVKVLERDPQRELTADLLYTRLQERFESWLSEREAQAEIIRFVDTGA
ncbi:MAG: SurA N-terminal domain-containing protein [Chloroflexota bacterium]|jgi:parvulin-like peptidyl-prolyl isomerase